MRYAIVSDIHANAQAWNVVLADIADQGADRILCLGDVVGYGPDPAPVLESVYRHVHAVAMGNHDAATAGRLDERCFTDPAREALCWTRNALDSRARSFLGGLPLVLDGGGFRCAHGGLDEPAAFPYLLDAADAVPSWAATPEPLLFVGHSHDPAIFVTGASGTPHRLPPEDFLLESGKRFLVNVGSVGCPRNGDCFAVYCLYDCAEGAVRFRRLPFDLDAYRASVARAGLPTAALHFLARDPRTRLRPIREQLSFAPPEERSGFARADTAVHAVSRRRSRPGRGRRPAALGAALTVLALAAAWSLRQTLSGPSPRAVPAAPLMTMPLTVPAGRPENILPPYSTVEPGGRLRNWRVIRQAPGAQTVAALSNGTEGPELHLESRASNASWRIEAPPVRLDHDRVRLRAIAQFRRAEDFRGHIVLVLDIVKVPPDGDPEPVPGFRRLEPRQPRAGGWMHAQTTVDFPRHTRRVQYAIEGEFEGRVELRNLTLERAD